jgi:hypothetical protein
MGEYAIVTMAGEGTSERSLTVRQYAGYQKKCFSPTLILQKLLAKQCKAL